MCVYVAITATILPTTLGYMDSAAVALKINGYGSESSLKGILEKGSVHWRGTWYVNVQGSVHWGGNFFLFITKIDQSQ